MNTDPTQYHPLHPQTKSYWLTLAALLLAIAIGAYCAYTMEHVGHKISGMNNSIVWGLPHVFAISLILTASGALNGATLSSVFEQSVYKPWARLSVVLAIVLLIGGLVVLVLDLGRPDRLVVAMTTYNFRSIFSWNIFLYVGFIALGMIYLATMLDRKFNRHTRSIGLVALIWRIVLTTGTGSIFGFLVGRSALDTAIMAPLFIALSLVMGTAVYALVIMLMSKWQRAAVSTTVTDALSRLLFWCLLLLVYFSIVHHLTNLYVAEHRQDEAFALAGGHAFLFWVGHVVVGVCVPLWLLRKSVFKSSTQYASYKTLGIACCAALLGGALLVYQVVIGSQSLAQNLFPGKTVTSSSFGDMGTASYLPSIWEWGLGIGGVSLAFTLLLFMLRILPVSPASQILSIPDSRNNNSQDDKEDGQSDDVSSAPQKAG